MIIKKIQIKLHWSGGNEVVYLDVDFPLTKCNKTVRISFKKGEAVDWCLKEFPHVEIWYHPFNNENKRIN